MSHRENPFTSMNKLNNKHILIFTPLYFFLSLIRITKLYLLINQKEVFLCYIQEKYKILYYSLNLCPFIGIFL